MKNKNIQTKNNEKFCLFYNSSIKFTINEWIKVYSIIWIMYLVFNTKNPIMNFLNTIKNKLLDESKMIYFVILFLSAFLYLFFILFGVYWAGGKEAVKSLFGKMKWVYILYLLGFGTLYIIFLIFSNQISSYIPYGVGVDYTDALFLFQYKSLPSFVIVTIHNFIFNLCSEICYVLIFLGMYQLFRRIFPKSKVIFLIFTYIVGAVFVGILYTTPYSPYIVHNILELGIPQIILFVAYRKSHNVLFPVLVKTLSIMIFIFLYVLLLV